MFGKESIDLGLVFQGQGAIIAQGDANAEVADRVDGVSLLMPFVSYFSDVFA